MYMRAPQPLRDKYTAPFWAGLMENRLRLPRCRACGHLLFPIGPCCSNCLSEELEWTDLSGRGQVWSYIVYHHAFDPAFADKLPYNVALVMLDEGPSMLTNIVDVANDDIRNGMRVTARFDRIDDDNALLRFRPDREAAE
jgi:uncharacterized OB-fold protein